MDRIALIKRNPTSRDVVWRIGHTRWAGKIGVPCTYFCVA